MNIISKDHISFYTVTENEDNQRIDNLLTKLLKSPPKSFIYRIIRNGEVRINKKKVEFSTKVKLGDIIRIPPVKIDVKPKEGKTVPHKNFSILFEDEYFLVINKPENLACHGGSGINFGVIEILRKQYSNLKFLELAHRLDRDTSGILVLAKKRIALTEFQKLLRSQKIFKSYLALTLGLWQQMKYEVKKPLFKYLTASGERRVKIDLVNGDFAYTIFNCKESFPSQNLTLVEANLKTGKTHQIRVHLQSLNHPIAGDDKYGIDEENKKLKALGLKRMFLHAAKLSFIHPITQAKLEINCPIEQSLLRFLNQIK